MIERDKTRQPAELVEADHDRAAFRAMGAEPVDQPRAARLEIDVESARPPSRHPQIDKRREVAFVEVAQSPDRDAHRSVSFSSMRRLRALAASSVPGSIGWNSPKPAAASRSGSTPLETRYCVTATARAAESSQFDLY